MTTQYTVEQLKEFVEDAYFWEVQPSGFRLSSIKGVYTFLYDEQVAEVDKRLPYLVREHSQFIESNGKPGLHGFAVDRCLQFWTDPNMTKVKIDAANTVAFKYIASINILENESTAIVQLSGSVYEIELFEGKDNPFLQNEYSVIQRDEVISIEKDFMDAQYPGWRERCAVAASFDIEPEQLAKFLTTPTATPLYSLPDSSDDLTAVLPSF